MNAEQIETTAKVALRLAQERKRQITEEGYTPEHDDDHDDGELALAAASYLIAGFPFPVIFDDINPFGAEFKIAVKEKDRIRQLEIAGAFIIAEIERLERAGEK